MKIILASNSPRRTEILKLANIDHQVVTSNIIEVVNSKLTPTEVVQDLAMQKASDVASRYPNDLIIGADTVVVINNEILGKPHTEQEAYEMISKISGQTHEVITGVCIVKNKQIETFAEHTYVTFYQMTNQEIIEYIHTEQVYDKAGAYAIQGIGCRYIKKIDGDYYNVMGLPISKLYHYLQNK